MRRKACIHVTDVGGLAARGQPEKTKFVDSVVGEKALSNIDRRRAARFSIIRPNLGDTGKSRLIHDMESTNEPLVRIPVVCPQCGSELLTEYPVGMVADALIKGEKISLYATCHDLIWNASPLEIEQLREYLGAVWIEARRS